MNFTKGKARFIRLALFLVLIGARGFLTACGGGSDGAGATVEQADPAQEKSWDKLVWGTGKWG